MSAENLGIRFAVAESFIVVEPSEIVLLQFICLYNVVDFRTGLVVNSCAALHNPF